MTTPRSLARTLRPVAGLALAAGLLAVAGCNPQTFFFLQPNNPSIPRSATDLDLKGKRVVILTHAAADTTLNSPGIDLEIAQRLASILRKKVKKIDVVDPDKVRSWAEDHPSWTKPSEAAEKFEADVVVYLEFDRFSLEDWRSPGLFEGRSTVQVKVTEMEYPKDDKGRPNKSKPREPREVVNDTKETAYPKHQGAMAPSNEVSRSVFRSKFVTEVVKDISGIFVDRDMGDDIQDTKF
ncbi:MAG TPA: hypothetical protein VG406_02095 [Isosphaeraceae bacterium]|jgi:hypothetical protein|nr:hypothetical protein [Isosphaeraceae bacterium]